MYKHATLKISFAFVLLFSIVSSYGAIPSGYYYFAQNKSKAELKTALHTYCSPLQELDYGSGEGFTWQGFYYTDRNATTNTVVDMYSDSVRYFNGFSSVDGMHIEHSFPKSWWGGYNNTAYKDLFHLYPADGLTNSTKNDLPLGEVIATAPFDNGVTKIGSNGFGTSYTGKCFEPADEFKGDFARSYFYIATVHEELANLLQSPMTVNKAYPWWQPWARDLLLKWNAADPVSEKELLRQEAVYGIQGNRNPFIDYPDLANYIWGADSTKVFPFPVETAAFLLTPRPGTKVDMGVILSTGTRTQDLFVQAANLTADLSCRLLHATRAISLSTNSILKNDALAGTNLKLSFSPTYSGWVADTLIIKGGGMTDSLMVPIKALSTTDFIALEPTELTAIGAKLQWISDPDATDYQLTLFKNVQEAGDLIISEYVEGSSWNKALELYNGTTQNIDLSKYSLQKQSNGAGGFYSTLKLSGTLAPAQTYVIAHIQAATELKAKANLLTDSILSFNGNDAVQLLRSGVPVDMVGVGNGGASNYWGQDLTLQRKSTVTHPQTLYAAADWSVLPIDSIAFIGTHQMTFAVLPKQIITQTLTGNVSSFVTEALTPLSKAFYTVEAIRAAGNRTTINSMQIKTAALDVPVAMEAEDINANSFTANWEEALYASGYELDVFQLEGSADTTEIEAFASVGSNGKPLPDGWTGTASGNYTSDTSFGIASPSISLKNNGEWLQTKTYTNPVKKFTFMCRFPSGGSSSSLSVYALSNSVWMKIDSIISTTTSKKYPVYNFTNGQGITAFKFIYNKSSGNLSIDDVAATYGGLDSVYVLKNESSNNNHFTVNGLNAESDYYYKVRATRNGVRSALSETIKVTTTKSTTALNSKVFSNISISQHNAEIQVSGLEGNEFVAVYTLTGQCVSIAKASSSQIAIPLINKGVYILQINNNKNKQSFKLLVY